MANGRSVYEQESGDTICIMMNNIAIYPKTVPEPFLTSFFFNEYNTML